MSCNCRSNLKDNGLKPAGIKAIWSEYKIPISVSGLAICGVILYNKIGNKNKQ